MQNQHPELVSYVQQQLQSGQTPDAIADQLKTVGWPEETVHAVFTTVQQQIMPSSLQATGVDTVPAPQANGRRRGRIRTGWQLFKQSWAVLRGNRYLLRYLLMTGLWAFGITIVFTVLYFVFDKSLFHNDYDESFKPLGYVLAFLDYVAIYFFINLYAAGLTANVIDIFEGRRRTYKEYMHAAWQKAPAILVFSTISATVGMILQFIVERIRFVGWILSWILGTAWSLGTLFVIPIIMTSDKPNGVTSVKTSMRFFKQTWGEAVTSKVTVNTPLMLLQLAWFGIFMLALFGMIGSGVDVFAAYFALLLLYFIVSLAISVVGSFANSLLNIALFYYATYHKVPPAFSQELLNQVFTVGKKPRPFGKRPKTETA